MKRKMFACFLLLFLGLSGTAQAACAPGGASSIVESLIYLIPIFIIFRLFRNRGGEDQDNGQGGYGHDERKPGQRTRHDAAQDMWDYLSSDGDSKPTTPTGNMDVADRPVGDNPHAGDFDEVEFLEGAKLFYSRYHEALSANDFDTIGSFLSPEVLRESVAIADAQPQGMATDIMLVTARILNTESEPQLKVTVSFDSTMRIGGGTPMEAHDIWVFSRSADSDFWVLTDISKPQ